jgi:hypothetical protein
MGTPLPKDSRSHIEEAVNVAYPPAAPPHPLHRRIFTPPDITTGQLHAQY